MEGAHTPRLAMEQRRTTSVPSIDLSKNRIFWLFKCSVCIRRPDKKCRRQTASAFVLKLQAIEQDTNTIIGRENRPPVTDTRLRFGMNGKKGDKNLCLKAGTRTLGGCG